MPFLLQVVEGKRQLVRTPAAVDPRPTDHQASHHGPGVGAESAQITKQVMQTPVRKLKRRRPRDNSPAGRLKQAQKLLKRQETRAHQALMEDNLTLSKETIDKIKITKKEIRKLERKTPTATVP